MTWFIVSYIFLPLLTIFSRMIGRNYQALSYLFDWIRAVFSMLSSFLDKTAPIDLSKQMDCLSLIVPLLGWILTGFLFWRPKPDSLTPSRLCGPIWFSVVFVGSSMMVLSLIETSIYLFEWALDENSVIGSSQKSFLAANSVVGFYMWHNIICSVIIKESSLVPSGTFVMLNMVFWIKDLISLFVHGFPAVVQISKLSYLLPITFYARIFLGMLFITFFFIGMYQKNSQLKIERQEKESASLEDKAKIKAAENEKKLNQERSGVNPESPFGVIEGFWRHRSTILSVVIPSSTFLKCMLVAHLAWLLFGSSLTFAFPMQVGYLLDNIGAVKTREGLVEVLETLLWSTFMTIMISTSRGSLNIGTMMETKLKDDRENRLSSRLYSQIVDLSIEMESIESRNIGPFYTNKVREFNALAEYFLHRVMVGLYKLAIIVVIFYRNFGLASFVPATFIILSYLINTEYSSRALFSGITKTPIQEKHWIQTTRLVSFPSLISLFNVKDRELKEIDILKEQVEDEAFKKNIRQQFARLIGNVMMRITQTGFSAIGYVLIYRGVATPGQLLFFLSIWTELTCEIVAVMTWPVFSGPCDIISLLRFFERVPLVTNRPNAIAKKLNGAIEFRDVSFKYPNKKTDRMILRNISFSVQPNQMVAIVGRSGAGKTTLIELLDRFYDPTSGSILIDGIDIRDLDLGCLRSQIGMVTQQPTMLETSIRKNILFGRENATQKEMEDACERLDIMRKIMSQEDKFEAEIGFNGIKLSGGERQRVSFARVLVTGARILILDEATSAVDTITENVIEKSILSMGGITRIVIAHRLSTIQKADHIVVIGDSGMIEEQGSFDKLLANKGLFFTMWDMQTKEASKEKEDKTKEHVESA